MARRRQCSHVDSACGGSGSRPHRGFHGTCSLRWARSALIVLLPSWLCSTGRVTYAWSPQGWQRSSFLSLWSKASEKTKDPSSTAPLFDEDTSSPDLWGGINASDTFGSLLMKMEKRTSELQEKGYTLEDDTLEIDPVAGNRTLATATSSSSISSSSAAELATEEREDSEELLLPSLDWESAQQIDDSVVKIRDDIGILTSVREISHSNPLGTIDSKGPPTTTVTTPIPVANITSRTSNDTATIPLSRRSKLYQRRMDRDQKLLILQVASSINTVEEWRTVCELTDGIFPLLELIEQGGNDTASDEAKDLARRSARALRDLCALSPETAAVITDGILRANYSYKGLFLKCLCQMLWSAQEVHGSSKTNNRRPVRRQQQETLQLYVTQLLLAMAVASDDAVHAIRETQGLKDAVLGCSSFGVKERRRRWLRYPGEMARWLWRSRKSSRANLRLPFLEAASVSNDLNGQVQRTANQVLAAIGYNQWIPKRPGQRGLRILCLDGGGSRGMVAVTAVAALIEAAEHGADVADSFDLLAGTSTGAIISFLVGLRQETSSDAVERYNQLIKQIFVKSALSTPLMLFTTATYDESPFMNILCNILSDDSMLDSRADPAVPLVFAVTSKMSSTPTHVSLFRNYNYAEGEYADPFTVDPQMARTQLGLSLDLEHPKIRYSKYKHRPRSTDVAPNTRPTNASRHPGSFRVLQRYALRASTAAPTVFKPVMMANEMYCDGGIVASNPTAVAIHEARTLFPDIPIELVVSIGTGAFLEQKSAPRIGWDGIIGQIVNSATDGEQVHHVLEDILGESSMLGRRSSVSRTRYYRFNPVIGLPDAFPIDVTDPEKLAKLQQITLDYMKEPEQQRKIKEIGDILKGRKRWKRWLP